MNNNALPYSSCFIWVEMWYVVAQVMFWNVSVQASWRNSREAWFRWHCHYRRRWFEYKCLSAGGKFQVNNLLLYKIYIIFLLFHLELDSTLIISWRGKNLKTQVIGCPKTIDGDLKCKEVPTSFGFDTACKVHWSLFRYSNCFLQILVLSVFDLLRLSIQYIYLSCFAS